MDLVGGSLFEHEAETSRWFERQIHNTLRCNILKTSQVQAISISKCPCAWAVLVIIQGYRRLPYAVPKAVNLLFLFSLLTGDCETKETELDTRNSNSNGGFL
jgi:hypothetical protein